MSHGFVNSAEIQAILSFPRSMLLSILVVLRLRFPGVHRTIAESMSSQLFQKSQLQQTATQSAGFTQSATNTSKFEQEPADECGLPRTRQPHTNSPGPAPAAAAQRAVPQPVAVGPTVRTALTRIVCRFGTASATSRCSAVTLLPQNSSLGSVCVGRRPDFRVDIFDPKCEVRLAVGGGPESGHCAARFSSPPGRLGCSAAWLRGPAAREAAPLGRRRRGYPLGPGLPYSVPRHPAAGAAGDRHAR